MQPDVKGPSHIVKQKTIYFFLIERENKIEWKDNISLLPKISRILPVNTLKKYIGYIPKDFNLSNVILSVIYVKKGLKVQFIPITFRPRQGGVNSINLKRIFGIGKKALGDFREINKTLKNLD